MMSNSTLEKIPFVKIQMVWEFYFTFWFFLSTLFSEQNSLDIFPVFHYTNKNFSVYMQLHIYIFLWIKNTYIPVDSCGSVCTIPCAWSLASSESLWIKFPKNTVKLYNKVTFDPFLVKKAINNCCLKFRDNAKNDAVQNVDLRLLHSQ